MLLLAIVFVSLSVTDGEDKETSYRGRAKIRVGGWYYYLRIQTHSETDCKHSSSIIAKRWDLRALSLRFSEDFQMRDYEIQCRCWCTLFCLSFQPTGHSIQQFESSKTSLRIGTFGFCKIVVQFLNYQRSTQLFTKNCTQPRHLIFRLTTAEKTLAALLISCFNYLN